MIEGNGAVAAREPRRVIWLFGLGYFAVYTLYAGLTKAVTSARWESGAGLSGFELLPAVILATVVTLALILTALRWWRFATTRVVAGIPLPWPRPGLVVSGLGTSVLIAATTLAFSFRGVSVVLALLMLRGGVLILAPLVDLALGRGVRWFCWAALGLSLSALALALSQVRDYHLDAVALGTVAWYLCGYSLRLPMMTRLAKTADPEVARRYFVDEAVVAMLALPLIPPCLALAGSNAIANASWRGLTTFWHSAALAPALAIGALYACLFVFGTLIYLDRRENTFCVPLNRGASLFAGLVATLAFGTTAVPWAQLVGAGLMGGALLLLSPAHHALEVALHIRNRVRNVALADDLERFSEKSSA